MRSVFPLNIFPVDQPNVSFIDQGGRLQQMTDAFLSHVASRESVQFCVYERGQFVERRLVSVIPCNQQLRHIMRRVRSHKDSALFATCVSNDEGPADTRVFAGSVYITSSAIGSLTQIAAFKKISSPWLSSLI